MSDAVLDAIKKVTPGEEFECDRAFMTGSAVFIRHNGTWTELRPIHGIKSLGKRAAEAFIKQMQKDQPVVGGGFGGEA